MSDKKQLVVITGASQGLGRAVAERFVRAGWETHGTGRSARPAELPESVAYHQFDASDAQACGEFWADLAPRLDGATVCLVNNAGGYVSGGLLESKREDYAAMMDSAYFTSVYMTRALAEHVPAARIINVVSTSALAAHPGNSAYGAAKAAQMHFFQALQQEFKPEQYQITNLYPSDIASYGPNAKAIEPGELAEFIRGLCEDELTYYLRDVTLYPRH
jgi:NAD(P)-dependent dehydrogenase (short-subunit alcohol dehydrogenase family)